MVKQMDLKYVPITCTIIFGLFTGIGIWIITFDFFTGLTYLLWGFSPLLFLTCCCLTSWQYFQNKTPVLPVTH